MSFSPKLKSFITFSFFSVFSLIGLFSFAENALATCPCTCIGPATSRFNVTDPTQCNNICAARNAAPGTPSSGGTKCACTLPSRPSFADLPDPSFCTAQCNSINAGSSCPVTPSGGGGDTGGGSGGSGVPARPPSTPSTPIDRTLPIYNTSCWRKTQCEENCGLPAKCYFEKSAACGGEESEWGRCYPNTDPIRLQIKLQGADTVTDAADYIARMYTYVVSIGGILATVMIIFGGIVYLTAGGNPGRIGEAKEYIGNALIGLVLLFTSYLLLQTLNPDLVKLSMPRTFVVRPRITGDFFCQDLKHAPGQELKFAKADKEATALVEANYNIASLDSLPCGEKFYELTTAEQTCTGSNCREGSLCLQEPGRDPFCKEGWIGGSIAYQSKCFGVDWIQLVALCPDGQTSAIYDGDDKNADHATERDYTYMLGDDSGEDISGITGACGGAAGTRFFMHLVMAEFDTFADDNSAFVIGKTSCAGAGSSSQYLTKVDAAADVSWQVSLSPQAVFVRWFMTKDEAGKEYTRQQGWTVEELRKGVACNLNLSPANFPTGGDLILDDCRIN